MRRLFEIGGAGSLVLCSTSRMSHGASAIVFLRFAMTVVIWFNAMSCLRLLLVTCNSFRFHDVPSTVARSHPFGNTWRRSCICSPTNDDALMRWRSVRDRTINLMEDQALGLSRHCKNAVPVLRCAHRVGSARRCVCETGPVEERFPVNDTCACLIPMPSIQMCISSENEAQAACMQLLEVYGIPKHCCAEGISLLLCE